MKSDQHQSIMEIFQVLEKVHNCTEQVHRLNAEMLKLADEILNIPDEELLDERSLDLLNRLNVLLEESRYLDSVFDQSIAKASDSIASAFSALTTGQIFH